MMQGIPYAVSKQNNGYRTATDAFPFSRNNTQGDVGTWDSDNTNYSIGGLLGEYLILLSAGYRYFNGQLIYHGNKGYVLSSTTYGVNA